MRFLCAGTMACLLACACSLTTPLDDLTGGNSGGGASVASSASATSSATTGSSGGGAGPSGSGGGPPMFDCSGEGTNTLADDFDDSVIAGDWESFSSSVSTSVVESNGQLIITVGPAIETVWSDIRSVKPYDLTSCYVQVKVNGVLNDNAGTFVGLTLYKPNVDTDYIELAKIGPNLRAVAWRGGGEPAATIEYDPALHAWWRIREAGGTIYFDVSQDGVNYSPMASAPAPFEVGALELSLIAGTHPPALEGSGEARFDRFNLPP